MIQIAGLLFCMLMGGGTKQRLHHPLSPNKEETNLEEFWVLKDINPEGNVVCPSFILPKILRQAIPIGQQYLFLLFFSFFFGKISA